MMTTEDAKTWTDAGDGSFIIQLDGKPTKLVKESNLLALKGGSEKREGELLAQVADANRQRDEGHQNLLQERAAKEQFEAKAKESETLTTKVGELETQKNAAETSRKQLEDELLGRVKSTLITNYKVKEDALNDKTLDQLRNDERTLGAYQGIMPPKSANFDGGGGGGTPPANLTHIEQAKAELKVARAQEAKRVSGDPDYNP